MRGGDLRQSGLFSSRLSFIAGETSKAHIPAAQSVVHYNLEIGMVVAALILTFSYENQVR